MIRRRIVRSLLAWLTTPMPRWTSSRTSKESAIALAQMTAEQRSALLLRTTIKLERR